MKLSEAVAMSGLGQITYDDVSSVYICSSPSQGFSYLLLLSFLCPCLNFFQISASIVNVNGLWIENKAIQTKKFNSSSSTKKGFPDKCNVSATPLLN